MGVSNEHPVARIMKQQTASPTTPLLYPPTPPVAKYLYHPSTTLMTLAPNLIDTKVWQ
jgi:hypothetical protein